jgi:hypothetical protein
MASHSTSAAGGGSTMPRVQTEVRGTGSPLAEEIAPEDAVVEVRMWPTLAVPADDSL